MKKRIILTLIIIIILLQYLCNFVFAQSNDIQTNEVLNEITNELSSDEQLELEDKREELKDKIGKTNVKLEYVKGELSETMIKLQEAEDKVLAFEQEMQLQQVQIDSLQASINEATSMLNTTSQDYNTKKEILANRLVAMYEGGETQYLDVLLNSKSITDFISRYYFIEEMTNYDNELINDVKNKKETIETIQNQLEEQQKQIREIKAQNEQTAIVLSNMQTIQSNYVNKLSEDEKKLQEEITAYKIDQAKIEAQILNSTNMIVDIQYTGGEMLWPVASSGTVITSNFGIREHPIQGVVKQHTGLDIGGVPTGTPVVAALDGVVAYAGWLGGYGNCVMINHGNGVITLYGHGNKVLTSVGRKIKQGETIMEVGSTGNSTGPHLHFEVRINGEYTNPLNYVKSP